MKNNPVYYLDDDHEDLQFFSEVASEMAIKVHLFTDGREMLQILHTSPEKPSFIFVDLHMPKISGHQIIFELKKMSTVKNIPVVVLSTTDDGFSVAASRQMGANYHIPKPRGILEMRNALEHVFKINWKTNQLGDTFLYDVVEE